MFEKIPFKSQVAFIDKLNDNFSHSLHKTSTSTLSTKPRQQQQQQFPHFLFSDISSNIKKKDSNKHIHSSICSFNKNHKNHLSPFSVHSNSTKLIERRFSDGLNELSYRISSTFNGGNTRSLVNGKRGSKKSNSSFCSLKRSKGKYNLADILSAACGTTTTTTTTTNFSRSSYSIPRSRRYSLMELNSNRHGSYSLIDGDKQQEKQKVKYNSNNNGSGSCSSIISTTEKSNSSNSVTRYSADWSYNQSQSNSITHNRLERCIDNISNKNNSYGHSLASTLSSDRSSISSSPISFNSSYSSSISNSLAHTNQGDKSEEKAQKALGSTFKNTFNKIGSYYTSSNNNNNNGNSKTVFLAYKQNNAQNSCSKYSDSKEVNSLNFVKEKLSKFIKSFNN